MENPPTSVKEIINANNIQNAKKCKAVLWIHIHAIYEIWHWFTQAKWGNNLISDNIISNITNSRLRKEIK
ncbi:21281_t:CDS:1, partial [Cetraspora pellucida]